MQKKARTRKGVCMFFLSLVGVAAVLLVITAALNSRITGLDQNIDDLRAEKQKYNKILQEIEKIKKDKKKLMTKIKAIKTLKSRSQVPVRLVDTVARAVSSPEDSLWLKSFKQNGDTLSLSGAAMDNSRLARFMDDLDASPHFQQVNLGQSSMTEVAGRHLKSFKLTLKINTDLLANQ
ncbi:MAG: PilN domain-containing protein [Desulfurivibrionaceae bacterium]